MPRTAESLIDACRKRLRAAQAAEEQQREQERLDLRFVVGGDKQWNDQSIAERKQSDGTAPPRPALTFNICANPTNRVANSIRQARPSIHFAPRGDGATEATADVKEGLARAIQYDSDAEIAFDTAEESMVACGRGEFRLDPELVDEELNQHDLKFSPIFDISTVYTDPHAKMPDRSDARWRIVLHRVSKIDYVDRWGQNKLDAYQSFVNFDGDVPGWWRDDEDSVTVAEYFCVERASGDEVAYADEDEPEAETKRRPPASPDGYRVVIHWIDGVQELQPPQERPGKIIPIFTMTGRQIVVEGERHNKGLVRDSRDPQTLVNYYGTKAAEAIAMNPTGMYWLTATEAQGHERQLQQMNRKLFPYMLFNPDPMVGGSRPTRDLGEPAIQAYMVAFQGAIMLTKETMGLQDPSLGKAQYAGQSGRAIADLQGESDDSTYHFAANSARALKTAGRVLSEWIDYYYDAEREISILGEDMRPEIVMVNTAGPYIDPQTGKQYQHQFGQGKYSVYVSVGPAHDTARQEADQLMSDTVAAAPQLLQVIGDQLFANKDVYGAKQIAERLRRWIQITMPGLVEDQAGLGQMAQAAAAVPALQAQIQQLQAQLQQAGIIIKTKQIENEGRIQVENVKQAGVIEKARIEQGTALVREHGEMARATQDHRRDMFKSHLEANLRAAEKALEMFHESELAPGGHPGEGLHPAPPPAPKPNGKPAA